MSIKAGLPDFTIIGVVAGLAGAILKIAQFSILPGPQLIPSETHTHFISVLPYMIVIDLICFGCFLAWALGLLWHHKKQPWGWVFLVTVFFAMMPLSWIWTFAWQGQSIWQRIQHHMPWINLVQGMAQLCLPFFFYIWARRRWGRHTLVNQSLMGAAVWGVLILVTWLGQHFMKLGPYSLLLTVKAMLLYLWFVFFSLQLLRNPHLLKES